MSPLANFHILDDLIFTQRLKTFLHTVSEHTTWKENCGMKKKKKKIRINTVEMGKS